MTFPEIYYAIHEQYQDDALYQRAKREVLRMSPEMWACWVEYCNRSIGG